MTTPIDRRGVVVAPVQSRMGQAIPMPNQTATTTTEIRNRLEVGDTRSMLSQNVPELLDRTSSASVKELVAVRAKRHRSQYLISFTAETLMSAGCILPTSVFTTSAACKTPLVRPSLVMIGSGAK